MSQYVNLLALSAVMFTASSCGFWNCSNKTEQAPAATEQVAQEQAPVEHNEDQSSPLAENEVNAAVHADEAATTLAMHEELAADSVVVDAAVQEATLAQGEPVMPMNEVTA